MIIPCAGAAAQDEDPESSTQQSPRTLDRVTVTGSLIPQAQIETFTPVTVITAEDIQSRGFAAISDVLQQSAFSTGGVQGSQSSASFTQGAETISLFGLPPGYVKYLIDGRPMASYPALYNGSDTFNNISGIPIDLVERIEILPGGQSSLYGSDAIAGVINVILKKEMQGSALNIRGGTFTEGGGNSFRASFSTGFQSADGRTNALLGVQYEERDPIWAYDRDLTRQFFTQGSSPPLASRDYLVLSPFTSYKFLDPANCANVSGQFGGTVGLQRRPGFGDEYYCGSFYTPGYRTLRNGKEATQIYGNLTFEINEGMQLYANVLHSDEKVDYHVGSNFTWWGSNTESMGYYYYDPNLDDYLSLQRAFAPEEMGPGGFRNTMQHDDSKSTRVAVGLNGVFGDSAWDYDVGYTRTDYKLEEVAFVRFAEPMDNYFRERVLGPQLGLDPTYGFYPVYSPDYAAFYQPISPQDFASLTGYATTESKTVDQMLRFQVTNTQLFELPGGDAGLAVVAEVGNQEWRYDPDPGYLDGTIWGTTAVSGGGERDRYALTTELRMPVLEPLTVTLSGRYDAFKPEGGGTIDKPTYSLGLEYRPFEELLIRGKYGTAFRSPTLSDLYQGESGFFIAVTDYYACSLLGFEPGNTDACPAALSNRQVFGTQEGNLDLQPINADVWSVGVVWSPVPRMSINVDYHNWDIADEVTQQSTDALMLQEYRCRTGLDDINSQLCTTTLSQVTRNPATDQITEIYTPKINVSRQTLEAVSAGINYAMDVGIGALTFRGNYTQKIDHQYQQYAEDPYIDLLNNPFWSTDPKQKADASITWATDHWASTVYANWFSETPNYRSEVLAHYDDPLARKLPSHLIYNASVSFSPIEPLQFSLLVNNVFNKMPPMDWSYPGTTGAPYNENNFNVYGRALYLEARYLFGRN
ncbi:TonB-dependent receptor [Luteimonas yindakuii]|uniref:TonB-dependent receptor n=1 Tax=Luteimonas yindakuii TaxID=2565782 RepID=A0A4Z1RMM5_9GAMM|nr:TonB-dependent receptor [Luteimonas yindakuii]TKS55309.1 TonB-dependent receptor [Luteimonas yindakuii]